VNYQIIIHKQAVKELSQLNRKLNQKIAQAIDALAQNPRPLGCKKLKAEQDYLWRIRIGNYRVIYSIDATIKIVEIRKIGHRKDIYEKK
jgi:mRNA interferase RelE/StbE